MKLNNSKSFQEQNAMKVLQIKKTLSNAKIKDFENKINEGLKNEKG